MMIGVPVGDVFVYVGETGPSHGDCMVDDILKN